MKRILIFFFFLLTVFCVSQENFPYPVGKKFIFGLYSFDVKDIKEMEDVVKFGWNLGHTYGQQIPLLEKLKSVGIYGFIRLKGKTEEEVKKEIEEYSKYDSVIWWDLPEERRWWVKEEFELIKNMTHWTRKYDPKKRPNFMYIPGHYNADAIAKYVSYLDIIGAGGYTEYHFQPRAWIRWRVESQIEAIKKAGYKIGRNYLEGEKIPIGILMCFGDKDLKYDIITPKEAYHDFYCAIASGAHGILIFSYFHRNDFDVLKRTFASYCKGVSEISTTELGEVLLEGENMPVEVEIKEGLKRTPVFRPFGSEEDISYPSITVRAIKWKEKIYIIAVNSNEFARQIKAVIKGIPQSKIKAEVMFENRTVDIKNGEIEDKFGYLEVHIYKIE